LYKKKERLIWTIEAHLGGFYNFRFNVVTRRVEFQEKSASTGFTPLDDRMENTLWCNLIKDGVDCKQNELHAVLYSEFSELYDPFISYFSSLPPWDGKTDYIAQLAKTVTVTKPILWEKSLRKWIVGMVACATLPDRDNHLVIILNSAQGKGKTSWCTELVPPELRNYCLSGIPRFDSRDTAISLSECIVVNLDELGTLSEREMNKLKELISKNVIRERRPYGRNNENFVRRASFTASVNNQQVISDLSGSRRFLCFDVSDINRSSKPDHTNIFSQAVHLLNSGFRYWLDDNEIEEVHSNNEDFRARSPEEELFYTYFRKPQEGEQGSVWLTPTQILDRLCSLTHLQMSRSGTIRIGILLARQGFNLIVRQGKKLYETIEISYEQVNAEKKAPRLS
jgi:predicted P-loop ATPase